VSRALVTALLGVVLATAGCGVGAGSKPGGTKLTITQDFGAKPVRSLDRPAVGGSETVMRLLARNAKVTTRYGGGFVQSIDGLAGSGARQLDWFYYVNGVEAPKGAAATRLHAGDHVWWDRHDWSAAMRVPAVVGAFPEPFVHGIGGKRLPVRVECSDPAGEPCAQVAERLASYKIPAARGGLRTAHIEETLRVLVGPWAALRDDDAIDDLERGPAASGVYARPSADGRTIALLDAAGHRVRTLGPGTGLVAATRRDDDPPTWVVTGTDAAGASSAARAFEEGTLEDRFALAVSHDLPIPLPEAPRS
jgi:hypothetical protein